MTAQEPTPKIVYVLGPGRSGTGVLGRALSTIEGTVFAGELRRLWSRGLRSGRTCGCGRPHAECEVWSKLLVPGATFAEPSLAEVGRIQKQAAPEHLGPRSALRLWRLSTPPPPSTAAGRYLEAYTDLHTAFARVTGADVVIDSSKSTADAALLRVRPDVTTYVVQILRDPRGVAFSLQNHPSEQTRLGPHLLAVRAAVRWVTKHVTNEAIRRRYGQDRSIMLKYEELIEHPRATIEAVAKLLGQPSPVVDLAPGVPIRVPEVHGPDGSKRRRFVTDEVVLELDTRWQQELHPVDRFLVTLLTYPLLRRYGYPIRTPRRYDPAERAAATPGGRS